MIIQLTGVPREITLHLQHDPDAWVHTFVTVKPEVLKKEAVRLGGKAAKSEKGFFKIDPDHSSGTP